jgi:hypothetical protein
MVDDSLLVGSAASGKRALAEEMVTCDATGNRLLPSESSICSITGKRVDIRELARSEVSGVAGLSSRMVRCLETGKLALPSEAIQCPLTGGPVLLSETEQCVITGRRINRRFGQRCTSTRKFFIDDQVSRQRMLELHGTPNILGVCQWTARTMLSNHLGKCALTGMEVDREQLNREGELVVLRQLLDGQSVEGSQPLGTKVLEWLRSAHPILRSAQDGVMCHNAARHTFVGAIRVRSGLLGLGSAYCAVAVSAGTPLSLVCAPVFGRRSAKGWSRQLP